jgi:hypothetical protein
MGGCAMKLRSGWLLDESDDSRIDAMRRCSKRTEIGQVNEYMR